MSLKKRLQAMFNGLAVSDETRDNVIDDLRDIFKRSDRIVWHLRHYKRVKLAAIPDEQLSRRQKRWINQYDGRYTERSDPPFKIATDSLAATTSLKHHIDRAIPANDAISYEYQTSLALLTEMNVNEIAYERSQKDKERSTEAYGTLLVTFGAGAWWNLEKPGCPIEAKLMNHCGNGTGATNQLVLSYRTQNDDATWTPHLTFIYNTATKSIGEMKAWGNQKPKEAYHEAIIALLEHPIIEKVVGGGYLPENNFSLDDLSVALLRRLGEKKPELLDIWHWIELEGSTSPGGIQMVERQLATQKQDPSDIKPEQIEQLFYQNGELLYGYSLLTCQNGHVWFDLDRLYEYETRSQIAYCAPDGKGGWKLLGAFTYQRKQGHLATIINSKSIKFPREPLLELLNHEAIQQLGERLSRLSQGLFSLPQLGEEAFKQLASDKPQLLNVEDWIELEGHQGANTRDAMHRLSSEQQEVPIPLKDLEFVFVEREIGIEYYTGHLALDLGSQGAWFQLTHFRTGLQSLEYKKPNEQGARRTQHRLGYRPNIKTVSSPLGEADRRDHAAIVSLLRSPLITQIKWHDDDDQCFRLSHLERLTRASLAREKPSLFAINDWIDLEGLQSPTALRLVGELLTGSSREQLKAVNAIFPSGESHDVGQLMIPVDAAGAWYRLREVVWHGERLASQERIVLKIRDGETWSTAFEFEVDSSNPKHLSSLVCVDDEPLEDEMLDYLFALFRHPEIDSYEEVFDELFDESGEFILSVMMLRKEQQLILAKEKPSLFTADNWCHLEGYGPESAEAALGLQREINNCREIEFDPARNEVILTYDDQDELLDKLFYHKERETINAILKVYHDGYYNVGTSSPTQHDYETVFNGQAAQIQIAGLVQQAMANGVFRDPTLTLEAIMADFSQICAIEEIEEELQAAYHRGEEDGAHIALSEALDAMGDSIQEVLGASESVNWWWEEGAFRLTIPVPHFLQRMSDRALYQTDIYQSYYNGGIFEKLEPSAAFEAVCADRLEGDGIEEPYYGFSGWSEESAIERLGENITMPKVRPQNNRECKKGALSFDQNAIIFEHPSTIEGVSVRRIFDALAAKQTSEISDPAIRKAGIALGVFSEGYEGRIYFSALGLGIKQHQQTPESALKATPDTLNLTMALS